jgi:hypothetical protein
VKDCPPTPLDEEPSQEGADRAGQPSQPDQAPIAAARSTPKNDAEINATLPGVSSAPPTPRNARTAIRTSMFGARPQAADATVNHTTPMRNTRQAPEVISQGATEQDQRRQRQHVPVDHPLQTGETGTQIATDVG